MNPTTTSPYYSTADVYGSVYTYTPLGDLHDSDLESSSDEEDAEVPKRKHRPKLAKPAPFLLSLSSTRGADYFLLRGIHSAQIHPLYDHTWWPLAKDLAANFPSASALLSKHLLRQIDPASIEDVELVAPGHFGKVFTGFSSTTQQRRFIKEQPLNSQFAIEIATTLVAASRDMPSPSLLGLTNAPPDSGVGPNNEPLVWTVFDVSLGVPADSLITQPELVDFPTLLLTSAIAVYRLHKARIIHNDIAARNFIATDLSHAQVIDFGLSVVVKSPKLGKRGVPYPYKPIPITQVPAEFIEAYLTKGEPYCSFATDVYAFGLYMWEVLSLGASPMTDIHGHNTSPAALAEALRTIRPPRPPSPLCTDELWTLMNWCWHVDPKQRPTMEQVIFTLSSTPTSSPWPSVSAVLDQPNVALFKAASLGDLSLMRYFVDCCHASPTSPEKRTRATPLHAASLSGSLECVKYLVEMQYADINAVDKLGNSPLMSLLSRDFVKPKRRSRKPTPQPKLSAVRYLVKTCRASTSTKNKVGKTAFDLALEHGWPKKVIRDTTSRETALRRVPMPSSAVRGARSSVVPLGQFAELAASARSERASTPPNAALFSACQDGSVRRARYAVERLHANPFVKNQVGRLPLSYAVAGGHASVVAFLLTFCEEVAVQLGSQSPASVLETCCSLSWTPAWLAASDESTRSDLLTIHASLQRVVFIGGVLDCRSCLSLHELLRSENAALQSVEVHATQSPPFEVELLSSLTQGRCSVAVLFQPPVDTLAELPNSLSQTPLEHLQRSSVAFAVRQLTTHQSLAHLLDVTDFDLSNRSSDADIVAASAAAALGARDVLSLNISGCLVTSTEPLTALLDTCQTRRANLAGGAFTHVPPLASMISSSSSLHTLDLGFNHLPIFSTDTAALIGVVVAASPTLRSLSLAGNQVDFASLLEAMPDSPLEVLDLSECRPDEQSLAAISQWIAHNKAVRKLSLRRNQIANVSGLAAGVRENASLQELFVGDNPVQDWSPLQQVLDEGRTLDGDVTRSIFKSTYHNYPFHCKKARRAVLDLLDEATSISELDLDKRGVSDGDMVAIAHGLRMNRTLEKLSASENAVSAVVELGDALCVNSTLLELDLSRNRLADASPLFDALRHNSTLTLVNLVGNQIVDVRALGEGLHSSSSLRTLWLDDNAISDVSPLGQALSTNTSLFSLSLRGNRVTDVRPLADALRVNRALVQLDLGSNKISDPAGMDDVLDTNNTLKYVYLRDNLLSASTQAAILAVWNAHTRGEASLVL